MVLPAGIAVFVGLGCGDSAKPLPKAVEVAAVKQENVARSSIGIRLIQDDWVLYRSEFNADDWRAKPLDGYTTKRVFRSPAGSVSEEEDYYYSGATFTNRDGIWSEFITVNYNYGSGQIRVLYTGTNRGVEARLAQFENCTPKVQETMLVVGGLVKNW